MAVSALSADGSTSVMMSAVPRYHTFEARLVSTSVAHAQPFALWCSVLVSGPATSRRPSMNISTFYDGNRTHAFRIAPDAVGEWRWRVAECTVALSDLLEQTGRFACVPSNSSGALLANGASLVRESGSPVATVGLEIDWLFAVALVRGADTARVLLDSLEAAGINHLMVQSFANTTSWDSLPARRFPRLSPTLVTPWASADQLTLDLRFFRAWDALLALLEERGLVAHLMPSALLKPQ